LPPPSKRALVFIDPPYEDKLDYRRAVSTLDEGLKHFATGVYALWYPNLSRLEAWQFPSQLKQLRAKGWLHVALNVSGPGPADTGIRGSGMFILNPPWGLRETLEQVMPCLADRLGQDQRAGFVLEYHEIPSTPTPAPALTLKRGG
jgi:23S rRNA (adenine2030-N6)-methyltransferase